MTQGTVFFLAFMGYTYIRPPQPIAASSARHKRNTFTSSLCAARRATSARKRMVEGLLQCAAPAQSLGSASPRGVLVTLRTLSEGLRERARVLALPRPAPLSSLSDLGWRLRDLALLSPPSLAPDIQWRACAKTDRRARARGKGGRTSLRASQAARTPAWEGTGKRWLWPGWLGFLWLCSWARRLGFLRCHRRVLAWTFCSGERLSSRPPRSIDGRACSLARGSVPAEQPWGGRGGHFVPTDSPEPGGAAGRGCGAAVAALGGTGRRHRRGFLDEAVRRSPAPSWVLFPTLSRSSGLRTPEWGVGYSERDRSLGAAGGERLSRSSQWRRRRTTCFSSCSWSGTQEWGRPASFFVFRMMPSIPPLFPP